MATHYPYRTVLAIACFEGDSGMWEHEVKEKPTNNSLPARSGSQKPPPKEAIHISCSLTRCMTFTTHYTKKPFALGSFSSLGYVGSIGSSFSFLSAIAVFLLSSGGNLET